MISKKLLITNIIVLILLIGMHTLGSYLILYPRKFNLEFVIEESQPFYLIIALSVFIIISWLVSHVRIKKLNPKNRFLLVFTVLCGLLLLYISYHNLNIFFKVKSQVTESENKYSKQAKEDIKKDSIIFETAGLPIFIYDQTTYQKIDSIRRNYGIMIKNTGCVVDIINIKGQDKYDEIVMPYLEKRNGKGWRKRMDDEIDKLEKINISSVRVK